MSTTALNIPYERQVAMENNRTCGAACLSMVYRSLGKDVPQAEIWPAISKENRFGSLASTTHLMAQDALNRGLAAVIIMARHPLQALRLCRESGIRAILNHRLTNDARTGHYTVLVDIDDKSVTLHDPYFGPARRISHAELLELWQPRVSNSEITGNVLIGIAAQATTANLCWLCQGAFPAAVECPRCKQPVGLQPNAVLGCMNTGCITRTWDYVCCPSCDYTWSFTMQAGQAGANTFGSAAGPNAAGAAAAGAAGAGAEQSPWMKALFGELDKFCDHVRSLPGATGHPELKQYLDMIGAHKEKIILAQAETIVYARMGRDQLQKMQAASNEKKEAQRKKVEEVNTPSAPLDGNALGRALLKNLGFTR
jgi:Peptidase C39 family